MRSRPTLLLILFAFTAAASAGARLNQTARPADDLLVIATPAEWVPFRADVINTHLHSISNGTFHRRRDGSTALILQTGGGGEVITIHNVQTRRTYVKLGEHGWHSKAIANDSLLPPQRDLRVFRSDVQMLSDPLLGQVIEHAQPSSGQLTRIAPSLNAFIISKRRANGTSQEFMNISIGDQPDELFEPPRGVPVKDTGR